jgi:lysophospholipase L1-like esterase
MGKPILKVLKENVETVQSSLAQKAKIVVADTLPPINVRDDANFYFHYGTQTITELDAPQKTNLLVHLDITNRGSSNASWEDLSGKGNHGTLVGFANTVDSGFIADSLKFSTSGTTEKVTFPTVTDNLAETTIIVEFKTDTSFPSADATTKYLGLFGKNTVGAKQFYVDVIGTNAIRNLRIGLGSTASNTKSGFINTSDKFHQVALTMKQGTGKLYIDGVLTNTYTYTENLMIDSLALGYAINSFVGKISKFFVYNKELTVSEIDYIYDPVITSQVLIAIEDSNGNRYEVAKADSTIITGDIIAPTFWGGKTMNINGDSIVYGLVNYPEIGDTVAIKYSDIIGDTLDMAVNNYGISGSTIAVKETDQTGRNPIARRYTSMVNNADLVIIAAGTNDWQYDWTPLGDMANRSEFTYYGALHTLCLGLLTKYPGKQLLFITPIKRSQAPYADPIAINANGKTLKEYGDIIKEVCGYYGIPVLDGYTEIAINPFVAEQKTLLIPDGTHPNDVGHQLIGNRVTGKLKSLS